MGIVRIVCAFAVALAVAFSAGAAAGAEFDDCVKKVRTEALGKGISAQVFDTALKGVEADPTVIESLNYQPEFRTPIWDYLAGLVDDQRIADGRARLTQWADVLGRIEREFGVDRYTVVAVWGVESDYGQRLGKRGLVRSLATVSCAGHRQRFFRNELIATLRILQNGDMPAEVLTGSWAGAFGQTQFMPTTYQRLAVDFDGDGRRDIVGSVPDALASTANFLKRAGWTSGEPWGYEVALPEGFAGASGRRNRRSVEKWREAGVRAIDGSPLSGGGSAGLIMPAGAKGPAFLVFSNFDAIYGYNASESYAVAIAHLSDRLRGAKAFATPWPTDDPGLSRAERREVQERLVALGNDIGVPDGIIGTRSRTAIEAFQKTAGLPVDGRAGMRTLLALRAAIPAK